MVTKLVLNAGGFSISTGRGAHVASKLTGKVKTVGKSGFFGDGVDGVPGKEELLGGPGDPALENILSRGLAKKGFKRIGKMAFTHMGESGQKVICKWVCEVVFNILKGRGKSGLGEEGL